MNRAAATVLATLLGAAALISTAACSGSTAKPTCQSLVGRPFNDAWDVKNNETKCSDGTGYTSLSFGCYNAAGAPTGKQIITISTSRGGKYFGLPGGSLMYTTDANLSLEQMNEKVGCGSVG